MKTEIELLLNYPPMILGCNPYFEQRSDRFDHGAVLCARGLKRYVSLPKDTQKITIRFFKRYAPESFEIGRRVVPRKSYNSLMFHEVQQYCMIDHPKTQLLQSFRYELYRYYINGFKFFRIEY